MAICVLFECPGVTQAQYDQALEKVTGGRPGKKLADWPASGLLSHVAGPTPNGWRVVDVWESEADLMKFAGVLMPIRDAVLCTAPQDEVCGVGPTCAWVVHPIGSVHGIDP